MINSNKLFTYYAETHSFNPAFAEYLVRTGFDPRNVHEGFSLLLAAVRNQWCCNQEVQECIKLGLASHQSEDQLFEPDYRSIDHIAYRLLLTLIIIYHTNRFLTSRAKKLLCKSPFVTSMVHGNENFIVALYEAGACNYRKLNNLRIVLPQVMSKLSDESDISNNVLLSEYSSESITKLFQNLQKVLPKLERFWSTPRSLASSCRLLFSKSLEVGVNRREVTNQLPVSEATKDYLLFEDVVQYVGIQHPRDAP